MTDTVTMDDVTNDDSNVIKVLEDEYDALNASITKLGSHIRELKKSSISGTAEELDIAIKELQQLKIQATEKQALLVQATSNSTTSNAGGSSNTSFDRKSFDDLIIRKMFIIPSFEIHGGVKGLFDLGPPACSLKVW